MGNIASTATGIGGPADDLVPITPNDTTDLPHVMRALYITGGGTLRVTTARGHVRNITVAGFMMLPLGVTRVHATGTTATGIHGVPV